MVKFLTKLLFVSRSFDIVRRTLLILQTGGTAAAEAAHAAFLMLRSPVSTYVNSA